MKEHTGILA